MMARLYEIEAVAIRYHGRSRHCILARNNAGRTHGC
jgi:hypothetical protein